ERLAAEAADGLTALPTRLDDAGAAEAPDVPRNERLAEPDVGDELGDGRLAVRQPAHDPEPVHVGHGLVEGTQLAQLLGLGDGRGDRAADANGGGGQRMGTPM